MAYSFAERRQHGLGKGQNVPLIYGPPVPGTDLGNAGAINADIKTGDLGVNSVSIPGYTFPGNYNAALDAFNTNFGAQTPAPAATGKDADIITAEAVARALDPEERRKLLQELREGRREDMRYAQELGKESAKEAFKYEMLGRIPDTIGAALSGQGQLMREGSRDIANIMMRGMDSIPEPRAAANNYQRPTFKYFQ